MSQAPNKAPIDCLSIGLPEQLRNQLGAILKSLRMIDVPFNIDKLMEPVQGAPGLILCGPPPSDVSLLEVGQVLSMQYQGVPIYLICGTDSRHDRKALVKNGFTDLFFLPLDKEVMVGTISYLITKIQSEGRIFKSVKLADVKENTVPDFDTYLYLPMNNKYIKYSEAGKELEKDRIDKLRKNNMSSLFVGQEDMEKFYNYSATVQKASGDSAGLGETEKSEKLRNEIRDVIAGLFSDASTGTDAGKKTVEECFRIIRTYIILPSKSEKKENWYERLCLTAGNTTDTYSRSANTASYAALFAQALGLPSAEDLALAGILHNIGLAKVPLSVHEKVPERWTPEERAEYERHPEYSVDLIKDRKLIVSELVYKIILQHHENFNGTGFPKKLPNNRICVEAQLLHLADMLDELTCVIPGRKVLTPDDAIGELRTIISKGAAQAAVDPELIKKLLALIPSGKS